MNDIEILAAVDEQERFILSLAAVFEYNPHRLHSALGYLSPVNFERRYAAQHPLH